MSRNWSRRFHDSLTGRWRSSGRQASVRRTRAQRRRSLLQTLESRRLLAVVAYDESVGGDLDDSSTAPVFVLDSAGTNFWRGTLNTPIDGFDGFAVELGSGVQVTDIRVSYTDTDAGTDPDAGVQVTGTGVFGHSFVGSETVSAGSFSDLNPTLPISNLNYTPQSLAEILFAATTATPAADWRIEIETSLVPLPPLITSLDSATVDENQTLAIDVNAIDDIDAEGAGLTYSIVGGEDQSLFTIDAATGVVRFISAPNFEQPSDIGLDNLYRLEVLVTDAVGLTDNQSLQISVADVNEAPVADAGGPYAIDAGLTLSVDASGTTDQDAGDSLSYGWDLDRNGVADFVSATPIATIPWLTVIDFISVGLHTIDLIVTDAGGLTSTDSATVDISDLFIYPAVSDGTDDAYTLVIAGANLRVIDSASSTLLSRVPVADIVQIAVLGSSDRDSLTIDLGGGFIVPPISFDGAAPSAAPGDSLRLVNGSVLSVEHRFVNESTGSITIQLDAVTTTTIQYTGLEPIVDDLDAFDRIFTFLGGAETIHLSDNGIAADGINQIDSTLGESVEFVNPTNSLTIHAGDGDDQVTLRELDSMSAFPNLTVNLDAGDDAIDVESLAALIVARINGGLGNDTFTIGTTTLDAIAGAIIIAGQEHTPIAAAPESVVAKPGTPDEVVVSQTIDHGDELILRDGGNTGAFDYTLNGNTFTRVDRPLVPTSITVSVTYDTIEAVNIETGSGADAFAITATATSVRTTIDTAAGSDSVTIATTGVGSLVTVTTGDDRDNVQVTSTGSSSVTRIFSGDDNDDVLVTTTGDASGLHADTGSGEDVITLVNTGATAATVLATDLGADVINLRGTALGSATDVFSGADNDTINLTSSADGDRVTRSGNLVGTLDGIIGNLCVDGGEHAGVMIGMSVSARQTIGDLASRSAMVETGDTLNVSDQASLISHSYTIDVDRLQRIGVGSITYLAIEEFLVASSQGDSSFAIAGTAPATSFSLETFSGLDTLSITTTGADSISRFTTGGGADAVVINSTGSGSVAEVSTGSSADNFSVASLGDQAGLRVATESGIDTIRLLAETAAPIRTGSAVMNLSAGDDDDLFDVSEVFLNTVVDLNGDGGDDEFLLTATGADTRGNLHRINDDPMGSAVVASTRQLFLDGGVNSVGTETVTQGVSVVGQFPIEGSVGSVATGDRITLNAVAADNVLDMRYVITGGARGVLATTVPVSAGQPRNTTGNEVFETLGVESVNVNSGAANDLLTVSSDLAIDITVTQQLLEFDGGLGDDKFEVFGSASNDFISVGLSGGGTLEPIELANVEFIRIDGNDGDDQISTQTAALGTLNGGVGRDIVFGGSNADLLTGGPGVDSLFGGPGNDVLLSDQDFGSDDTFVTAGELLSGGSQVSLSPGDVCIQLGVDTVRDCETLGDGGAIKDVLTWLRAIIIPVDSVSFSGDNEFLEPFEAVAQDPVAVDAVTEPSQITTVPAMLSAISIGLPEFEATDVNRDGIISARDALIVINHVARMQDHRALGEQTIGQNDRSKDVNGNGTIEALDALIVINRIAKQTTAEAEGESTLVSDWIRSVDDVFRTKGSGLFDEEVHLLNQF